MALADHADDEGGSIFPGLALVAWKTGYSKRNVQRIINALVEKGILVLEDENFGRWGTNRYRINWEACPQKAPLSRGRTSRPSDNMSSGGSDNVSKRDDNVSKRDDILSVGSDIPMSPKPSGKPSSKPTSNRGGEAPPTTRSANQEIETDEAPRTDGTHSKGRRPSPGTLVPESFPITEQMEEWAHSKGYVGSQSDLELATERFINYHRSKGSVFTDWTPAWRNWVLGDIQGGLRSTGTNATRSNTSNSYTGGYARGKSPERATINADNYKPGGKYYYLTPEGQRARMQPNATTTPVVVVRGVQDPKAPEPDEEDLPS
jgi:hypothetical protein